MSLPLMLAFSAVLFLFLLVWLPVRQGPPDEGKLTQSTSGVELTHPKGRAAVGTFLVVLPLVGIPRLLSELEAGNLTNVLGFFAMAACSAGVGMCIWAYARRKVVLDQRGVRIVGFGAREVGWDELKDIKAVDHGALKDIQFVPKRGRRIVLDSTMPGWDDLEQRLLELASGSAKPLAQAAMVELKRWRTQ